jgi:hypothetical protein
MTVKLVHPEWKEGKLIEISDPAPLGINIPMPGKARWEGELDPIQEAVFPIAHFALNAQLSLESEYLIYTVDGK